MSARQSSTATRPQPSRRREWREGRRPLSSFGPADSYPLHFREVTSHALIGAAIFTFVLFTRDLGRILELVVRASAPLPSVAEIFFYTVPLALTYTIPMSVLVGILIGL